MPMRRRTLLAAVCLLAVAPAAQAQYVQRQVVTTNGAVTFIGNSLGLNKAGSPTDGPGTSGSIGAFVTTNTTLRKNASWPLGTTSDWKLNSSTAILNLPAGSTVIYAELIWGGSWAYGGENVSAFLNGAVNLTTPAGTSSVAPDPATAKTGGTAGIRRQQAPVIAACPAFTPAPPTSQDRESRRLHSHRAPRAGDQYSITALGLQIDVGAPRDLLSTERRPSIGVQQVLGNTLTYTVRLDNADGTGRCRQRRLPGAAAWRVRRSCPAALRSTAPRTASANPVTGVAIGTVAAGNARTVTFQLHVDAIPSLPAPAEIDVTPTWSYTFVSCAGQPAQPASFATNTAVTGLARIDATKSVTPSSSQPNQILSYSISLTNTGTAPSSGTLVNDAIPVGTIYMPGSTTLNGAAVADQTGTSPLVVGMLVSSLGASPGVAASGRRGRRRVSSTRGSLENHVRRQHRGHRSRRTEWSGAVVSARGDDGDHARRRICRSRRRVPRRRSRAPAFHTRSTSGMRGRRSRPPCR